MTTVKPFDTAPFSVGDWRIEPALGRISRDREETTLEPKTMAVLQHLAEHAGEVVSGDDLIERIWEGRPMSDNPVYKCIAQLRKVLGDSSRDPEYIATVPKRGYRLLATVRSGSETREHADAAGPASRRSGNLARLGVALGLVGLLVAVVLAWNHVNNPATAEAPDVPVLAVLPFQLDADLPADMPSGANMARAVIERLARERGVQLIAHDSSAIVADAGFDAARAARRLGASHVLLGTVERDPDGIAARLTLADASGRALWEHTYRGSAQTPTRLLDEIVTATAAQFDIQLDPALSAGCRGTRTISACQVYLLAHEHLLDRGTDYRVKAIELMQRAIAEDPSFAPAHADLAMLYLMPDADQRWNEVMALARSSIKRALELDPDLAEAHATRGLLLMRDENKACPPDCFRLDLDASIAALRRAIELNPGLARAHNWLAIVLYAMGDYKAAEAGFERALGYDPMNPVLHYNSALFAAYRGQPEIAERIITDFRAYHPDPPDYLLTGLAVISDLYGEFTQSLRHARERQAASEDADAFNYHVAKAYINLGMLDEAERHLSLADGPDLIGSATLTVRTELHQARSETAELAALVERLSREARAIYGKRANWPRWALRAAGREFSLIGDHTRSIEHYQLLYREPFDPLDYQAVAEELDGMLFHAHSLESRGRQDEARRLIRAGLDIFEGLEQQGYAALPDLVYAKAVAHALLNERALAIATLRQAVSRGWRRFWLVTSDPRWASFREEADFNQLLGEIQDQVAALRNTVDSGTIRTPDIADPHWPSDPH